VYLPYGEEWYPYLVRRLAERPANLVFFVRALLAEALAGRPDGRP
jgi:proline dehydrogenase